jgi:acetoin utilization deacetylase AcuC-like enzyme
MSTSLEPIGIVDDVCFDAHRSPDGPHPERPERLIAAREGLLAATSEAQRTPIAIVDAKHEELSGPHSERYIKALDLQLSRYREGMLDGDTYFCEGTRQAAFSAAAGAASLARALMSGSLRRGVALLRPPGHHAERESAMGFCLINNVAVAAHAALGSGAKKVAIIDWDVHHGNGTEHAFESDPRVLFISLHQYPFYPGTGAASSIGKGEGRGYTGNLALPGELGDEVYAEAFRRVVLPMVDQFAPDLILVSAGYDAHHRDPLASMQLQSASYGAMASALVELSEKLGHGRVGLVLEGGYDLQALRESMELSVRALAGKRYAFDESAPSSVGRAAIDATAQALSPKWDLTTKS